MKLKKEKVATKKTLSLAVSKKKKKLSKITMDEFLEQDFESDNESDDENDNAANDSDSGESDLDPKEHKKSLMKLRDTDPGFYWFLKQNDTDLLNFDVSDDDEDVSDDENDAKHAPNMNLEVASDESDYQSEDSEESTSKGLIKVTLKSIASWEESLEKENSLKTIKIAVELFHAATKTLSSKIDDKTDKEPSRYKVEGSAIFNRVVQMCVMHFPEALKRFLNLGTQTRFEAHKTKRFVKVKSSVKSYLKDLIKLLRCVTSSNIITVLLKHFHQMLPFTQCYSSLRKPVLKILLKFWSSGEEAVRVTAFLCILQMATSRTESVLETLLKMMYIKYVQNSNFVSPNFLPGINFMRHSLIEIYLLDSNFAYRHAFLFVRQLAINLRNAVTLKKRENFKAVYNWQFINSLKFWAEMISLSKPQSMMKNLLYPLVQIIIGTIKLVPTSQYYPLRFHCVKMLMNISKETGTFIPILPFLLEVLTDYNFNKKHKAALMKPMSLICLLRISKSQQQENTFKDSVIETIHELIFENAANDSYKVYFPDAYIPCVIQLKAFLKKCNVANYCRKIRSLLDKIEENRKYIEKERSATTFDFKNMKEFSNWEINVKREGTPLIKFYDDWMAVHQINKMKLLTQNDELADNKLPSIKKFRINRIPASDDKDLDMKEEFERRQKKRQKLKKPSKVKKSYRLERDLSREDTDIVEDINMDDWD